MWIQSDTMNALAHSLLLHPRGRDYSPDYMDRLKSHVHVYRRQTKQINMDSSKIKQI